MDKGMNWRGRKGRVREGGRRESEGGGEGSILSLLLLTERSQSCEVTKTAALRMLYFAMIFVA